MGFVSICMLTAFCNTDLSLSSQQRSLGITLTMVFLSCNVAIVAKVMASDWDQHQIQDVLCCSPNSFSTVISISNIDQMAGAQLLL
ncbi:hypothetical protein BV25DRAFT_1012806 [Artomyces pyxidatus]|uniref:Uncharacterized protein n=1 Tax=Artomyces pyxidatus TaxID=48021 RepID=A0ACB8SUZ0_9AGAM|nr:hypothetical protein BV25DRAFT_1012806 [Artomyces pyxidatus]